MYKHLKNYLIVLMVFSFLGCLSSPPQKSETQELIEKYKRLNELQEENLKLQEENYKKFTAMFNDLKASCATLRTHKS